MHYIRKNKNEDLTTADIAGPRPAETPSDQKPDFTAGEKDVKERDESRATGPQLVTGEPSETQGKGPEERPSALFPEKEVLEMRSRWTSIQTGFVDEPRRAVEEADSLVALAMKRLADQFAGERLRLEHQWERGENVSTEQLRHALREYRAFFDRLLSV